MAETVFLDPHDEGECECRKPLPGMLHRAAEELPDVDLGRSVVIGDAESDMEAGRAVGARMIRLGDGRDLAGAVKWLLER